MWVPELKEVYQIHDPWNMNEQQQKTSGVKIGIDYPKPIDCAKYTNPSQA